MAKVRISKVEPDKDELKTEKLIEKNLGKVKAINKGKTQRKTITKNNTNDKSIDK